MSLTFIHLFFAHNSVNLCSQGLHQQTYHSFDDDRTGYVDHEQFVRRAADDFNPGDNAGTSTAIVQTSQNNVTDFNTNQMIRRDDLLLNNIKALKYMSNEDLEKQLRLDISCLHGKSSFCDIIESISS